jgi:RNA-directed DNA polymerase
MAAGSRRAAYEPRRRGTEGLRTRPSTGSPGWGALQEGTRPKAQPWDAMSPGRLTGVARAQRAPAGRFHALAPRIDGSALQRASRRQRADAAGGDGITKAQYGQERETHLQDRHARLQAQRYRHQPIRRGHMPTAHGKTRPLGLSACEDTGVQDAVREVLAAISEQAFFDGSSGCRPGRSAHAAVRTLQQIVDTGEGRWICAADMVACFDRVERPERKKRRAVRSADGALWRLLGTGVHVEVLDGEAVGEPELGIAQGAVRSPVLGNVYWHDVLDRWCETEVQPRLQGRATLRRFCADCLLGVERQDDARRVQAVLGTRWGRFGLPRHPDTTRWLPLWRPPSGQQRGTGPAPFACLGCTFSGMRTRTGHWRMGCKTRRASRRRAKTALYAWCRRPRHQAIEGQHAALCQR